MAGITMFYRRNIPLVSKRDAIEVGVQARTDSTDQTDTRLTPLGKKNGMFTDATIHATDIAGYADTSIYPWRRFVLRGGTRLDSLSFGVTDRTDNSGLERTAQGFHLGNKAIIDYAAGKGAHLIASYGEGFRSPQARELKEGDRVPFTTTRGVEAGIKWKKKDALQASLVGFGQWLSHDRVFDAFTRQNAEAPASSRIGIATALTLRKGPFGSSVSATYTRARFSESDAHFRQGQAVPYAPALVIRSDTFVNSSLGRFQGRHVMAKIGAGFEGIAGRTMPDGQNGKASVMVDALASIGWRSVELGIQGTNLLNFRGYDSQFAYASNFERSATLGPATNHVLVTPPAALFATLQIHVRGPTSEVSTYADPARCLEKAASTAEEELCSGRDPWGR
jgi:hypothetical protein